MTRWSTAAKSENGIKITSPVSQFTERIPPNQAAAVNRASSAKHAVITGVCHMQNLIRLIDPDHLGVPSNIQNLFRLLRAPGDEKEAA